MAPIVDGLEARYGQAVTFARLDALDGAAGQRAFEAAGLPGHPGFLLRLPDGSEQWRGFGQQSVGTLEAAIRAVLGGR